MIAALIFALAASAQPPAAMIGLWARDGRCTDPASRLRITASTAAMGRGKPERVQYAADDGPGGYGALHWTQEGEVSNLAYVPDRRMIVFNAQGWGFPPTAKYLPCPSRP